MNDEEVGSVGLLRLKYRRGEQIIQTFWKIGSPLFNLYKFENPERSNPGSYKMHWNLINEEEFESKKLFKLKYRMGDQRIQTFCKVGSPQKLVHPSLICKNFRTLGKVFVIHAEWTEM